MDLRITRHPGSAALEALAREREAARAVGQTAIMLGKNWNPEDSDEAPDDAAQFADMLAAVDLLRIGDLLDRRREEHAQQLAALADDSEMPDIAEHILGEWPGELDHMGPTLHRDILSDRPHPEVAIARIDAPASWQIPVALGFGGWNDCPYPLVHGAYAKRWSMLYHADIIGISHDVIEWEVRKPPRTKEAAMTLAWEQYLYCADIVDQGVETISNLGGTLLNGNHWYFWWD